MGDGKRNVLGGLILCTDSYTIQETVRLINALIIRYYFICTLRKANKDQYQIYISEKSMNSLRTIVSPYMADTMLYKLKKKAQALNSQP